MNKELDQVMTAMAAEVFESLAFLIPMPEEDGPSNSSPRIAAQVAFSGPFGGALALSVDAAMLPALAANMLGTEEGTAVSQDHQNDAFKELLNVLCGNLLPIIAGKEAVFDVHAPQLLEGAVLPDTSSEGSPVWTAELCVDAGKAELRLFVDGKLPAETVSAS
jgi:CheY-specific phosphatase CheX